MYSEKDFKRHILWIRIKRLFFLFVFSIIGCVLGVISSSYIVDILLFDANLKPTIIAASTIVFFLISLLLSSNSSRYIQDCLWKIETLHILNNLSEKLDDIKNVEKAEQISSAISSLKDSLIENKVPIEESEVIEIDTKTLVEPENKPEESSEEIKEQIEDYTSKDIIEDTEVGKHIVVEKPKVKDDKKKKSPKNNNKKKNASKKKKKSKKK